MLLADPLEPIRDLQDVREVLFRVAWHDPPEVALLKVLRPFLWVRSVTSFHFHRVSEEAAHVFAGDEASPERRVRDDLDPELARRFEQPDLGVLDVEREGRILDLQCQDGVHGVCAAERLFGDFRQADVLDLASPEEQR